MPTNERRPLSDNRKARLWGDDGQMGLMSFGEGDAESLKKESECV
jgi:hypothetical protein